MYLKKLSNADKIIKIIKYYKIIQYKNNTNIFKKKITFAYKIYI